MSTFWASNYLRPLNTMGETFSICHRRKETSLEIELEEKDSQFFPKRAQEDHACSVECIKGEIESIKREKANYTKTYRTCYLQNLVAETKALPGAAKIIRCLFNTTPRSSNYEFYISSLRFARRTKKFKWSTQPLARHFKVEDLDSNCKVKLTTLQTVRVFKLELLRILECQRLKEELKQN